jgi:hypothetical protein
MMEFGKRFKVEQGWTAEPANTPASSTPAASIAASAASHWNPPLR